MQHSTADAHSAEHTLKTRVIQLEEQNRQLTLDFEDGRRQVARLQSESARLEHQLADCQQSLAQEQGAAKRLHEQLAQVKATSAALETTRTELMRKLEQSHFESLEKQDQLDALKDQVAGYTKKAASSLTERAKAQAE